MGALEQWHEFDVAMLGAAAALAGLGTGLVALAWAAASRGGVG